MMNTYSTLPPAAGSGDLNTFQLAACCLRSGFSLFPSASFSLPTTDSKSAVLSGLMKFSTIPASDANVRAVGAAWAAWAGAPVAGGVAGAACANAVAADKVPTTNPNTILRSIEASYTKGRYSSVLSATRTRPSLREQGAFPGGSG